MQLWVEQNGEPVARLVEPGCSTASWVDVAGTIVVRVIAPFG
jgi:hypothetical protein